MKGDEKLMDTQHKRIELRQKVVILLFAIFLIIVSVVYQETIFFRFNKLFSFAKLLYQRELIYFVKVDDGVFNIYRDNKDLIVGEKIGDDTAKIIRQAANDFPIFIKNELPEACLSIDRKSYVINIILMDKDGYDDFERIDQAEEIFCGEKVEGTMARYYFCLPFSKLILVKFSDEGFNIGQRMTIRHEVFHYLVSAYSLERFFDKNKEEDFAFKFQYYKR